MGKYEATVYMKPFCSWTSGVLSVLEKHQIPFNLIDISNDVDAYREMVEKTGQYMTPCVDINGHMLVDVGGSEVEDWLIEASFKSQGKEHDNC